MTERKDYRKSWVHKVVSVSFGSTFVICAMVLLFYSDPAHHGILYLLGVALLALLGLNQVMSALKEKDSVMDRFGPLP